MSPCCQTCSVGTEVASVCTECATVTVAGASVGAPTLIVGALVAAVAVFAWKSIRHQAAMLARSGRPALG